MNEQEMENQLRSWQPRRPSRRIERALFGREKRAKAREVWLQCLPPAVACVFLAVTIIHQEPGFSARLGQGQYVAASSNLTYTAAFPKQHTTDQNEIAHASFEWTNLSESSSSIGPFSPGL